MCYTGPNMSRNHQVSIARGMEGIDHSPTERRTRRRLRKTGVGPAGPSQKAVARLAGRTSDRNEKIATEKKAAQLARRRELAAAKKAAALAAETETA